jgi:hypothetical protein
MHGVSHSGAAGVAGFNDNPSGGPPLFGDSKAGEGVHATAHGSAAGVAGFNDGTGAGIHGESQGTGPAGFFKGDVVVTGTLKVAVDVVLTNGGRSGSESEDFRDVRPSELKLRRQIANDVFLEQPPLVHVAPHNKSRDRHDKLS